MTAVALARDAVASSRDDPDTLRFAAHALSHFAHDYELALATLDRALRLNPNSAQILIIAGWVHLHCCDPEPALDLFGRALRLSPLDQEMGLMLWGTGMAHLMAGLKPDPRCGQGDAELSSDLSSAGVRVGTLRPDR
jgi:adenylate cyclase